MNKENFNPETVGAGKPLSKVMGIGSPVTNSKILDALNDGKRVRLKGASWYVFKQVPSIVPASVVPKMSSLPESVKKDLSERNVDLIYKDQYCAVQPDGNITGFHTRFITDYADWEILNY